MDDICRLPIDPTAEEEAMQEFAAAIKKYRWYRGLQTHLAMTLQKIHDNPMVTPTYLDHVFALYKTASQRMFDESQRSETMYLRVLKERTRSGNEIQLESGD